MDSKELHDQLRKYDYALRTLETHLQILLNEYTYQNNYNPVEHIKSRIKSIESATNKLVSRGYDVTIENLVDHVHDMVGIRIVCSFLSDVQSVVELIKSSTQIKIIKEKDYISQPKETGYISYHLAVNVPVYYNGKIEDIEAEIQIRTVAMDFWASLDHKIRYKFISDIPEDIRDEMFKCSLDIQNLDKKMQKLNDTMRKYNN